MGSILRAEPVWGVEPQPPPAPGGEHGLRVIVPAFQGTGENLNETDAHDQESGNHW
ncbi:hypothetical protein [Spirosoma areae]